MRSGDKGIDALRAERAKGLGPRPFGLSERTQPLKQHSGRVRRPPDTLPKKSSLMAIARGNRFLAPLAAILMIVCQVHAQGLNQPPSPPPSIGITDSLVALPGQPVQSIGAYLSGMGFMAGGGIALSAGGAYIQPNIPPSSTFSSWLLSPIIGGQAPYGYLGTFGLIVGASNYGDMGITGASHTNAGNSSSIASGINGVAVNDQSTVGQIKTAWPGYFTGARLAGTGGIQLESDVANVSNEIVDINPFSGSTNGPPGTTINWVLSPGGEPPHVGSVPNGVTSGIIMIENNGQTTRHGLVFGAGLFSPSYCTTNCPAIDMPGGHEFRQVFDATDLYGSFVRYNVPSATGANGLEFKPAGAIFETGGGLLTGAIINATPTTNWPYVQLSATANNAVVQPGSGNGATVANLELGGLGASAVIQLDNPVKFASSSTGASTQTFTNSPCSGLTTEKWIPVQITGQTGTWFIPACQ